MLIAEEDFLNLKRKSRNLEDWYKLSERRFAAQNTVWKKNEKKMNLSEKNEFWIEVKIF